MFVERLENWGAWVRSGELKGGHCASIEHRYRSPQTWYPPEPLPCIDVLDAQAVQDAISGAVQAKYITTDESRALLYHHGWKFVNRHRAAKRCGVRTPEELIRCAEIAQNLLRKWITRHSWDSYHHPNNLNFASA